MASQSNHTPKTSKVPFLGWVLFSLIAIFFSLTTCNYGQGKKVEQIAGNYYKVGTIEKISKLALKKSKQDEIRIRKQIDHAYNLIEINVENFLNWYYNPIHEYPRTAMLVTGNYEKHIEEKLEEHLLSGNPFNQIAITINRIEKNIESDPDYKRVLEENLIKRALLSEQNHKDEFTVVENLDSLKSIPHLIRILNISMKIKRHFFDQHRVGGKNAALRPIVEKMNNKGFFNAAAKILKKVTPKLLGGPPLTVAVDFTILKGEELLFRENFKEEIIQGIQDSKDSLLSSFSH